MTGDVFLPHAVAGMPLTDPDDRVCVCLDGLDDHLIDSRIRLVCGEKGCSCREFVCIEHSVRGINGEVGDCFASTSTEEETPA